MISTHAPLAGRDKRSGYLQQRDANFNPRAPCGARRRQRAAEIYHAADFNPRAPCGARLAASSGRRR